MNIQDYIKKNYNENEHWFVEELNRPYHAKRITDALNKINYLKGNHNVANREDAVYKGKEFITRKTIIQYAKTVIDFHTSYLVGKPITLTGNEETVKTFREIYKLGLYDSTDYKIVDHVNKFGDAYEVVYVEDNVIKSKILANQDSYPVYNELGEYIAFIEHWTDAYTSIKYYNVYYPNYVERFTNDGGNIYKYDENINICGLPIHYHNESIDNELFGESILDDIMPLLDDLEDIYSKLGDAIYVNTLNPLPISLGVRLDSAVPADATGYVLNLENGGDFKVVSTTMDYDNIKYYIDTLRTMINEVGCIPCVLSNTEVSNISEMSMKMLFHLAGIKATASQKWLTKGLQERFNKWRTILGLQGIGANGEVQVIYNLNIPINCNEMYANLEKLKNIGAISVRTVMENAEYILDADAEQERIAFEEDKKNGNVAIEEIGEKIKNKENLKGIQ